MYQLSLTLILLVQSGRSHLNISSHKLEYPYDRGTTLEKEYQLLSDTEPDTMEVPNKC